ncbi:Gr28a.2 family protein [Megaselia abdita]
MSSAGGGHISTCLFDNRFGETVPDGKATTLFRVKSFEQIVEGHERKTEPTKYSFESCLEKAMRLEQDLSEASELINEGFRIQVLLMSLESFLGITFNCFYVISLVFSPSLFKLGTTDTVMFLLHHLAQPIFNILVIVLAYQMLANSFKTLNKLVNKCAIYTEEDRIRKRLTQFSLQIHTNAPQFTIFGMFALDQ